MVVTALDYEREVTGLFTPSYIGLRKSGKLKKRIDAAQELLVSCHVCPRDCGANRLEDDRGFCEVGRLPLVSSYNPHYGEESPLVGRFGSGTIFLTSCNLRCCFCQNYDISHGMEGRTVSPERLAGMMVELQAIGCHNINFVTPTHVVPQILAALPFAIEKGLKVPLVYNCGGYESVDTLKLLTDIFDVYMPDFKFGNSEVGSKFCDVPDYPERARGAFKEMHRQVGDLVVNEEGIAERGLLVRHLVMPGGLAGTREVMRFLVKEVSKDTYVNIMDQYRPCGTAHDYPPLDRRITSTEYEEALRIAEQEGIHRLDQRDRRLIFWV